MTEITKSKCDNLIKVLQDTHEEALIKNEELTRYWNKIKVEYVTLLSVLESLPASLSHTVMVPIGTKGLMHGKIVHSNEILVCLGDGWFVKRSSKQAQEICNRRIKTCEEMIGKLDTERALLETRKDLPIEMEAFGGKDTQEIIEDYDEEKEAEWRVLHRQKEKEYRQKLSELRKKEHKPVTTEEDLWKRLDELELQEELEEEIDRLHAEVRGSDDSDDDFEDEYDEDSDEDLGRNELIKDRIQQLNFELEKEKSELAKSKSDSSHSNKDKRVLFIDEQGEAQTSTSENEPESEPFRITFKHTEIEETCVKLVENKDSIQSPSDIYHHYIKSKNENPKSILKVKANMSVSLNKNAGYSQVETVGIMDEGFDDKASVMNKPLGDVVEHNPQELNEPIAPSQRPISKFRASRAQKR